MDIGALLGIAFCVILVLVIPGFATLRTVQAFQDSKMPYLEFGFLAHVGLLLMASPWLDLPAAGGRGATGRRSRALREENAKLKRLVADLSLDKHILGEIVRNKL